MKKTGGGGSIQENYNPENGRYISQEQSKQIAEQENETKYVMKNLFGIDYKNKTNSIESLPKTTTALTKRKFVKDLSAFEKYHYFKLVTELYGEKMKRISLLAANPTINDVSLERNQMRTNWINEEIEAQSKNKRYESEAYIILGLPGSGKSTIAKPIMEQMGAYVIDADEIKKRIPEFQEDEDAISQVHQESVACANTMMDELMNKKANMVIGKVGGYAPDILNLAKKLNENNYKIKVILNDLPFDIAMDRNKMRYESGETKRIVPFHTIFDSDGKINETYDMLMELPFVDGGLIYTNDVPKGTRPKLIRKDRIEENFIL